MRIQSPSTIILTLALIACGSADSEPDPEPARESNALALGGSAPQYTAQGELVRRDDWADWVFLGAALNLSYTEEPIATDVLSNVFMEPTAFHHFEQTGEFPEGTLIAAVVYLASGDATPAESGLYAGQELLFEMSAKDSALDPLVPWRYYSFAEDAASATANPREACFDCHTEHAATDHVFTQFYPVLRELAAARAP